jgi:hypothetical protein
MAQEYLEKKKKKTVFTPDNDDRIRGMDTRPRIWESNSRPGKSNKESKDVNLPDEKKDKIVGYMDLITSDFRPEMRQSRPIYGGDPDDPRWDEYNRDKEKNSVEPSDKMKKKLRVK